MHSLIKDIAKVVHTLSSGYYHNAVIYLQAVIALWDNELVASCDTCDEDTASELQLFQRNVNVVLFVADNEFYSLQPVVHQSVQRSYVVSERILLCTDILEYLIYRDSLW